MLAFMFDPRFKNMWLITMFWVMKILLLCLLNMTKNIVTFTNGGKQVVTDA